MTSRFAKLSGASGLIRSPFTKPSAISSQLKIATRPCTRLRFRKEIAVRVRKSHKLQSFSQIDLVRPGSLKECRAWRPTTTPLWDPTIVPSARTKGVCLLGDRERLGRFREGNCGAGDSISWRRQRAHRCNDAQSDSRARGTDSLPDECAVQAQAPHRSRRKDYTYQLALERSPIQCRATTSGRTP